MEKKVFKLYYASAIDTCVEEAFKQIEEFKKIFKPYTYNCDECIFLEDTMNQVDKCKKCHKLEVYGAGFGDSPILDGSESSIKKGVICAYDLRKLRECDVLLVVTDLKQFAAGTMMELEYARNLGIYIIIMVLQEKKLCDECPDFKNNMEKMIECANTCNQMLPKLKNIFLETYANKIIYSMEELEEILKELTK
jgi:nucleoside 2-deoxyribosyltransferase